MGIRRKGRRGGAKGRAVRALGMLLLAALLPARARSASEDVFLFPYFKDPDTQGVFLLASADGRSFQHVNGGNAIFEVPAGVTRDPSIARGPDGLFHMVWTSAPKQIGHASSPDLVNWSAPQSIPVWGPEAHVLNTWAPELFYDQAAQEFLIVWASTDRDRFPTGSSEPASAPDGGSFEHRLYATTTRDFESFSPTRLFFDPGFNVIDGMIAYDAVGGRFAMAFKDERIFDADGRPDPQKNIRLAFSDEAQGVYGDVTSSLTGGGLAFSQWAEGPTLIAVEGGWRLYFDTYLDWSTVYNAYESEDLESWIDVSDTLEFPEISGRLQHGTVFRTSRQSIGWVVPEPATGALVAAGLLGLALRRRRCAETRAAPRCSRSRAPGSPSTTRSGLTMPSAGSRR